METVTSMGRVVSEEQREEEPTQEALQLVKNEERVEQEQALDASNAGNEQAVAEMNSNGASRDSSPHPHSQSVITSRRAVRTITAAGHITTDTGDLGHDEGVKDEPPETSQMEHEQHQLQQYAPKLEESDGRDAPQQHYDEERLRLAEAETARYLAFKQEPYRTLQSPAPADKRLPPQYARAPQRPPYGRGLALRYGAPHHVIVAQEGETEDHGHEAFLTHKDKAEHLQVYATSAEGANGPGDGRQYAAVLSDQAAASTALEMIQTTSLSNQQSVGIAYQQVKYETRGEGDPRPTTYASLQPVSVHGGYAYSGQSPQYGSAGYGAYTGGGKELLTLYGGGAPGPSTARGDESPPGQLMYRSDPTLSSSSLTARGAHVVYGSVVPQSQTVYEAPPSPNSQQVGQVSY